ncbi:glycosyltransferase [Crocosphaera sp. XPORK-15E]|uniref:glycosyltransferase n=1 Tax=Crocosphaera sp. XPORK-15E TaxID=3110247 RepID=UPI002B1F7D35|nr:glycosyltransferase [Crocosphaera sp. XPORK-15E]MEA5534302.1 glycosyltransferase [Crocosphaera sp. XPORK-15E]
METISIIIPVLNEEKVIKQNLLRLKHSSGIEIILADGGSQDQTILIAQNMGVKVVFCTQKGRAYQMNQGASIATGDILLFLVIVGVYSGYQLLYAFLGYRTLLNILQTSGISSFIRQLLMSIYDISINQILFYVLPYGCLFALGILAVNLNRQNFLKMFLFFLGIFITGL